MITIEKPAVNSYELLDPVRQGACSIVSQTFRAHSDSENTFEALLPKFNLRIDTGAQQVARKFSIGIVCGVQGGR